MLQSEALGQVPAGVCSSQCTQRATPAWVIQASSAPPLRAANAAGIVSHHAGEMARRAFRR